MADVGIDGCKGGWVAVELPLQREPTAHYLEHIGDVAVAVPAAEVIGIDIPIGLAGLR